jgi:hypothetical protein
MFTWMARYLKDRRYSVCLAWLHSVGAAGGVESTTGSATAAGAGSTAAGVAVTTGATFFTVFLGRAWPGLLHPEAGVTTGATFFTVFLAVVFLTAVFLTAFLAVVFFVAFLAADFLAVGMVISSRTIHLYILFCSRKNHNILYGFSGKCQ